MVVKVLSALPSPTHPVLWKVNHELRVKVTSGDVPSGQTHERTDAQMYSDTSSSYTKYDIIPC